MSAGLQDDHNDSVSKSLRILQLLGSCESMGVSDVSRELGIAVSTAHRVLNIMRAHGFVTQDRDTRRYQLGNAALQLGRRSYRARDLRSACHPILVRLRSELDESVEFMILDGPEVLLIDGLQSRRLPRIATRTGARMPAYATAGGKVLLARMPYVALRSNFPDELRRLTQFTVPDFPSLERELERVRLRGFALDRGENMAEMRSIAVAVNNDRGRPVAAVAVVGPTDRWGIRKLKTLAPRLSGAATEISRALISRAS